MNRNLLARLLVTATAVAFLLLASITTFPQIDAGVYEERLKPLQSTLRAIQQAYLGTREHAIVLLEGWDTAGSCTSTIPLVIA